MSRTSKTEYEKIFRKHEKEKMSRREKTMTDSHATGGGLLFLDSGAPLLKKGGADVVRCRLSEAIGDR